MVAVFSKEFVPPETTTCGDALLPSSLNADSHHTQKISMFSRFEGRTITCPTDVFEKNWDINQHSLSHLGPIIVYK